MIKTINEAIERAPWIDSVFYQDEYAARVCAVDRTWLFYLTDHCRCIELRDDYKTALETARLDGAINLESVRKALEL